MRIQRRLRARRGHGSTSSADSIKLLDRWTTPVASSVPQCACRTPATFPFKLSLLLGAYALQNGQPYSPRNAVDELWTIHGWVLRPTESGSGEGPHWARRTSSHYGNGFASVPGSFGASSLGERTAVRRTEGRTRAGSFRGMFVCRAACHVRASRSASTQTASPRNTKAVRFVPDGLSQSVCGFCAREGTQTGLTAANGRAFRLHGGLASRVVPLNVRPDQSTQ